MKKRSHSRRSASRKASRRTSKSSLLFPFSFRRIIFITTCLAIFGLFVLVKSQGVQSVAGIQITKGLFAQATVTLPQVEGAISYSIYYKEKGESTYKNAVRD